LYACVCDDEGRKEKKRRSGWCLLISPDKDHIPEKSHRSIRHCTLDTGAARARASIIEKARIKTRESLLLGGGGTGPRGREQGSAVCARTHTHAKGCFVIPPYQDMGARAGPTARVSWTERKKKKTKRLDPVCRMDDGDNPQSRAASTSSCWPFSDRVHPYLLAGPARVAGPPPFDADQMMTS
jgi:hypothetical protein